MPLGGGGQDRARENATKLSSLTKIQPFYWTNSRRSLVNFQSPEKVDVDHFDEWSSCFCGGAGFWGPYSILEVLFFRRNVYNLYLSADETDKLSCSICVPVSGFFERPSSHWGCSRKHGFMRKCPGLAPLVPRASSLSWEPISSPFTPRPASGSQPQHQLTSITVLGHVIHFWAPGNFHYSFASAALHLKDRHHILPVILKLFFKQENSWVILIGIFLVKGGLYIF